MGCSCICVNNKLPLWQAAFIIPLYAPIDSIDLCGEWIRGEDKTDQPHL